MLCHSSLAFSLQEPQGEWSEEPKTLQWLWLSPWPHSAYTVPQPVLAHLGRQRAHPAYAMGLAVLKLGPSYCAQCPVTETRSSESHWSRKEARLVL